jgi:hypothetical protein
MRRHIPVRSSCNLLNLTAVTQLPNTDIDILGLRGLVFLRSIFKVSPGIRRTARQGHF